METDKDKLIEKANELFAILQAIKPMPWRIFGEWLEVRSELKRRHGVVI